VLTTHKRSGAAETDWTPALFDQCKNDAFLAAALNEAPPDANLNLNRTSCTACPPGTVRNADFSACVPCNGVIVGNTCQQCLPDVIIDGSTLATGTTLTFPSNTPQPEGDLCPNVLWVEVTNVPAVFSAHPDTTALTGNVVWSPISDQAQCVRTHTLFSASQTGSDPFVYSTQAVPGSFSCTPTGFCICTGGPAVSVPGTNVSFTNMQFGVPAGGPDNLTITATAPIIIPS
jgi:hypothetical protein